MTTSSYGEEERSPFWDGFSEELGKAAAQGLLKIVKYSEAVKEPEGDRALVVCHFIWYLIIAKLS